MLKHNFTVNFTLCFMFILALSVSNGALEFLKHEKKDNLRNLGSTNCTAKIEKSGNFIIKCEKEGEKNAHHDKNLSLITEKMKNEDILKFMQLGKIAKENNKKGISNKSIFDLSTLRKNQEIILKFLMMPYSNSKGKAANEKRNFLYQRDERDLESTVSLPGKGSETKQSPGKFNNEQLNENLDKSNKTKDLVVQNTDNFSFFHSKEI